ncbi:MAG TPA: ABC transporter permease, partial [Longimicrobiales bacterium]|nr:ABC transporter permease [Longimicrobiales bacterium]
GQNLKFGIRLLRKSPGLLAVAALSLGLGIGVNTTVFSLVHAVLYRMPEVDSPAELVNLYTRREGTEGFSTSSGADWADLRERTRALEELAGYSWAILNVELEGKPTLEVGSLVTAGYFEMLGVQPTLGRTFLPEEERAGGPPAVVLTHRFWRRALQERPDVVGETLRIGGTEFLVAGVLPRGFNGLLRGLEAELFVPASQIKLVEPAGEIWTQGRRTEGLDRFQWRGFRFLTLTGRLREGVSAGKARAEVETLMANLATEHPDSNERLSGTVLPTAKVRLNPQIDGTLIPGATLVLVMAGLVLLVACANLANMLLARATSRRREIGVRLALGATRRQLISQLLLESSLLAAVGVASGLVVAAIGMRLLTLVRLDLPISPTLELHLDPPVMLFALASATVTGLFCGLAPAIEASRTDLVPALKAEAGSDVAPAAKRWRPSLGSTLVVAQVAFSLILVVGASLLTRSVSAARSTDLGFEAKPLGVLTLDLDTLKLGPDVARGRIDQLVARVEALPGVAAAGVATRAVLGLNMWNGDFYIPGFRESADDPPIALEVTHVDPGYFDTMGLELLEGRLFDERDRSDTPRVAVVTEAMARRFWPREGALGRRFRVSQPDAPEVEIVGVVRDYTVISPSESPRPFVHVAWSQNGSQSGLLVFRTTSGPAANLLDSVYREVQRAEPEAFIADSTTFERMRDTILLPVRAGGAVFACMGGLALILAGTGLAGLIAYRVSQRTREIGLRMALGAGQRNIVQRVLGQTLTLVAIGTVIGLAGVFVLGSVLQSVLYVSEWDPLSIL